MDELKDKEGEQGVGEEGVLVCGISLVVNAAILISCFDCEQSSSVGA